MTANIATGRSTAWLKIKSYMVEEYDLLGVEREPGKPAFALMADRETGQDVGSAFINSRGAIRDRLWKRVQEHAGPASKGIKRPAAQWVRPGLIGRVKHLRRTRILPSHAFRNPAGEIFSGS
ncbi:hypothetical protein [Mesorhizobium sp. 128a]